MQTTDTLQDLMGSLAASIAQAVHVQELSTLRNRAETEVERAVRGGEDLRMAALSVAEINEALVDRLIGLEQVRLEAQGRRQPSVGFTWLSLGSSGRREQILRTDQDNALLYDDPPEVEKEVARLYFSELAREVCSGLTACGFASCAGDNMASRTEWCRPLSAWKGCFSQWIRVPEDKALLNASIVFDFLPAAGDAALALRLREHISSELKEFPTCLILLARNTLRNLPCRGLLGHLLVEQKRGHRETFDIKLRAMKPLADAARVLALDAGVHTLTGTQDRMERLARGDRSIAELSSAVISAYTTFMRCRVLFGDRGTEGGRFLDLTAMKSAELEELHRGLDAVKPLLELVRVRYQIDALGLV